MEYQDFTIEICSNAQGRFEAKVAEAGTKVPSVMTFDRSIDQQWIEDCDKRGSQPFEEAGQKLYSALFGNGVQELFRERQAALDGTASGLRIRLKFRLDDMEAEYLAALPWEWLWDPEKNEFLATNPRTPVIRDFSKDPAPSSDVLNFTVTDRPLRILIVDAVPITQGVLKLEREVHRIFRALAPLEEAGVVELLALRRNTLVDFRNALGAGPIHILHFMGHGGYNKEHKFGAIFFETQDGREDQVGGIAFAEYLKSNPELRLVVLNSCYSARHAGYARPSLYSGVASAILDQTRISAVVANQFAITDQAAILASQSFYRRIAAGVGVDEALTSARAQLFPQSREWATPVLFLSTSNSKIFDGTSAEAQPTVPLRERFQRDEAPIRLGIRSFDGHDGWGGDMEARNDKVLDLLRYFDRRYILKEEWWQEKIFPELRTFLLTHSDVRRPLILDFAAHASIAFAAGWIFAAKSGFDVRITQRSMAEGEREWHQQEGEIPEGPLWLNLSDSSTPSPKGADVALALAVTHSTVPEEAGAFIQRKELPVRRLLTAEIAPAAGQDGVRGGAHSFALVQELLPRLRQRAAEERGGSLHLFCAAPNALLFYLGQLARPLGRLVLYEYAFGATDSFSRYRRSIELPPPGKDPDAVQPIPWED